MQPLGVNSTFNERGVVLTKIPHQKEVSIDFTHCPDIAQTLSVVAAAKNIKLSLSGLESLRIKETDRIYAIQTELAKFGASMNEAEEGVFVVESDSFKIDNQIVDTYDDHRMAMAFAPLALHGDIIIEEPDVVKKSYPGYWNDLKAVGFSIENN
jgi:3-phosphoshikimate 1-carboxyvinyltransferase